MANEPRRFGIAFVRPRNFYGGRWWTYLVPRRITLRSRSYRIYRWLCWNVMLGGDLRGRRDV